MSLSEDLIIHIFEYVEYDFDFLAECSLISHIFTAASQKRLFQQVKISDRAYAAGLEASLRSSPHIAGYIQKLRIVSTAPPGDALEWGPYRDTQPLESLPGWTSEEPDVLPHILDHLNGLRSLEITGYTDLRWNILTSTLQDAIIRLLELPSLVELVLKATSFPRFLLSLPKKLKYLHLQPPHFMKEGVPMFDPDVQHHSPLDPRKPRIERLTITRAYRLDAIESLGQVVDLNNLKEIYASCVSCAALQWVGRVVQMSVQTLVVFEWNHPDSFFDEDASGVVQVAIPLGLKHLKLGVHMDRFGDSELAVPHVWAVRALRELVRNASSASLLETIEIYEQHMTTEWRANQTPQGYESGVLLPQILKGNSWLQLDILLSKEHVFNNIKLIVTLDELPRDEGVWSAWLEEMGGQMPRLFSQGKVELRLPTYL